MRNTLLCILLGIVILETLIEPGVCGSISSRRRTKGNEKEEKKDKKDQDEKEEDVDLSQISPNATFSCTRCEGKYCSDAFLKFKIDVETVECAPGELCWKSKTSLGYYRGCASRECIQNESSNEFEVANSSNIFLNNICCTSDNCNFANVIRLNYGLALAFQAVYIIFIL